MPKRATHALAVLALLLVWQAASWAVDRPILPGPVPVAETFAAVFFSKIWPHLVASAGRVLLSIALASGLAMPLGLAAGRNPSLDAVVAPVVRVLYPVPKIVFLPLILLFLGLGEASKVFLVGLIIFFQMLVATRDAARAIDEEFLLSVRSMGAGRAASFLHVVLPACLPNVLTTLRINVGTALAVLFLVESIATWRGLGHFILDAWERVNYEEMYAGIVAFSLLGIVFFELLDLAEKRLCRWMSL